MTPGLDRRRFLELSALSAGALTSACAATRRLVTPGRLRHAGVGVGGMGKADLDQISKHPDVEITVLCDVDEDHLAAAQELYPNARAFTDWREMFAEAEDAFDSVSVTIPDHMHAPVMLAALDARKHVYGQKPLTRTVEESRAVAHAAARAGVATQMGIQNHSNQPYAEAHALFRAGHIGEVYEVHVWSDRPAGWWPQGVDRPEGEDAVPPGLHWDEWLGVAPRRPYKDKIYHPFAWRGWKDFGTGAQGDMGCHLMDPAVWFLELGAPLTVRSDGPRPTSETYPLWSRVDYEFPATEHTTRGPLRFTWHDGGKQVYREILEDIGALAVLEAPDENGQPGKVWSNACLFLGTKGALLASPYASPLLLPKERFPVGMPDVQGTNHWHQWIDACRGSGVASAPFDYAARLTEVVLLGNVALHFPHETLEWNGRRFGSHSEANAYLGQDYREGWG